MPILQFLKQVFKDHVSNRTFLPEWLMLELDHLKHIQLHSDALPGLQKIAIYEHDNSPLTFSFACGWASLEQSIVVRTRWLKRESVPCSQTERVFFLDLVLRMQFWDILLEQTFFRCHDLSIIRGDQRQAAAYVNNVPSPQWFVWAGSTGFRLDQSC